MFSGPFLRLLAERRIARPGKGNLSSFEAKPGRGMGAWQRGLLEGPGSETRGGGRVTMKCRPFGFKNAMVINPLAELQPP